MHFNLSVQTCICLEVVLETSAQQNDDAMMTSVPCLNHVLAYLLGNVRVTGYVHSISNFVFHLLYLKALLYLRERMQLLTACLSKIRFHIQTSPETGSANPNKRAFSSRKQMNVPMDHLPQGWGLCIT